MQVHVPEHGQCCTQGEQFRASLAALVPLPARVAAVAVLAEEAVVVDLLVPLCGGFVLANSGLKALRCRCFGAFGEVVIRPFSVVDNKGVELTEADLDGPVQAVPDVDRCRARRSSCRRNYYPLWTVIRVISRRRQARAP